MSLITLRIRGPKGASSLKVSPEATLMELKRQIESQTDISPARQELRLGFPPKPIAAADVGASLTALGIANGESLIVAELEETAPSPAKPTEPVASAPPAPATDSTRPPQPTPRARSTAPPVPRSVQVEGGYLVHRIVPDDNSCLFTAVGLVLEPGKPDAASHLRKQVAEAIRVQPDEYSDAMLGQPRDQYIRKILMPDAWGGAIELAVFSAQYRAEIISIDVQTGRLDHFGQEQGYETMVILVYSGIHYDCLTFSYIEPVPSLTFPPPNIEFDQTSFPSTPPFADVMLCAAQELVAQLRKEHQYTDAATFTLKCEVCGKAIVGEKEARAHAEETKHSRFGEYDG